MDKRPRVGLSAQVHLLRARLCHVLLSGFAPRWLLIAGSPSVHYSACVRRIIYHFCRSCLPRPRIDTRTLATYWLLLPLVAPSSSLCPATARAADQSGAEKQVGPACDSAPMLLCEPRSSQHGPQDRRTSSPLASASPIQAVAGLAQCSIQIVSDGLPCYSATPLLGLHCQLTI